MKIFFINFFCLFTFTTAIAQEKELITADLLEVVNDYQQLEVDSILSIRLPVEVFESTDDDEGIYSDYWVAYGEDDMTFMIHRAKMDERICVSNQMELEVHYDEAIDGWKDSEVGLKELSNLFYEANNVYQAEFSFQQYDEELDQMTHNDYRIIQIKETFYQIGILQPLKTKSKSRNDLFFNSIEIDEGYQLENQFTECNSFDLLFDNDTDHSSNSSAYDTGYAIGELIGGFLCVGVMAGLFALVIFLMIRKNKKNRQKEWDQFNS